MTEATRAMLGTRVEAKDCGTLPVYGRTQPLRVYELLALHPE
jgi:class 3 adenylate cyclase